MSKLNRLHTVNNEFLSYKQAIESLTIKRIKLIDDELLLLSGVIPTTDRSDGIKRCSILDLNLERDHLLTIVDILDKI